MEKYKQKLGKKGEDRAEEYLKTKGFVILAKHYHYGHKEIDLVGKDGNTIVFVEVKTGIRSPGGVGQPQEAEKSDSDGFIFHSKREYCRMRFPVRCFSHKFRRGKGGNQSRKKRIHGYLGILGLLSSF
jgi:hypothetical protein